MKFLDALRGPQVQRNDMSFQDWINAFQQNVLSYPGQWPGYQFTYGKDPAEPIANSFAGYVAGGLQSNGVIFALELKRLQVFSQARFQYQRMRKGRPGDLFGDDSLNILERPWPGGTTGDMLARMILDADFAGNNWQVPLDDEIVRLRPDYVEIVLQPRMLPLGPDGEDVQVGFKQIGILYYEGGINAGVKPAVFLPGEYSHFAPIPDPLAAYRGMSWLTPVIRELQADTSATKHKLKFFENAASPNIAVSLPKEITPQQFEAFVEKMDSRHKGVEHAYETLYTGGGADVTVIGANMQQMDFKVTQGAGETRLAAAAGIHPVVVALSEGMQGSSLNAGNYTAAKRNTVDTTFRHLWQNAAGSLAPVVPVPDDARLWYDARDIPFLHEDQKDVAQIQQAQASAWRQLVDGGLKPDAATAFIQTNDLSALLGQHSGLYSVQLQPPGPDQQPAGETAPKAPAAEAARSSGEPADEWDDDPIGDLDEDTEALIYALDRYAPKAERALSGAAFNAKHKRGPDGRFLTMVDRIINALNEHKKNGGKGDPFAGFDREPLRKAARARGIALKKGEDRDSIAAKLLADLGGSPAKESPTPAAAPTPKAAATTVKKASAAVPNDGLDALDERRLKSLATEYEVDTSLSRDDIIEALRVQGALAPDVTFRRTDERKGLLERLKNMGRRPPADNGPLERAVIALAEDTDAKLVAKQLRKDAEGLARKEDADTLRFLASDLTKKKTGPPPYINERGRIDLVKLGETHGINVREWMPLDKAPDHGLEMSAYRGANPFDPIFRRFSNDLGNPAKPTSRSKAIAIARTAVAVLRDDHADAVAGRGRWSRPSWENDRKHYIERGLQAAADLERLADLAEAAKVPPGKRAVTLGATSLGEVVPIDEGRFRTIPIKRVLKHRGEDIPEGFVHKGLATSLLKDPNRPHRPGLTKDESYAMDLYTAVAVADGLNGSLRKGRNVHGTVKIRTGETIDLDKVQRDMDAAIANGSLARDTILWRGALVAKADYRRIVPGAVLSETGYLSTTSHEKAARDIIAWRQQQPLAKGRQPVLFKFLAPAGTNAALGHEALSEAVLPHGQEARVVRLDESVSPPVAILEVIPRNAEPGFVRGRDLVGDFDYDNAAKGPSGSNMVKGVPDSWLGAIQKAQGFDGKPTVVSRQEMDETVRGGALELFRGLKPIDSKTATELADEYRSGKLYPGTGVYGNGTYASPDFATARKYASGNEKNMLRMALRRDAKVISIEDLHKLRPRTGITATAAKLANERQAELNAVDPSDTAAVKAIMDRYEVLASKQGARSRVAQDLGRVAALLGYDAIYVPKDYRGAGSKFDNQTEYIILNRTATIVEEATP